MKRAFISSILLLLSAQPVWLLAFTEEAGTVPRELCRAASNGDEARVRRLLKKGAEVNAGDPVGMSSLMYAAENGRLGTVKLLISKGADVNARNKKYGTTPLIIAAMNGRKDAVAELISKGAEVNAVDNNGMTALHHVATHNTPDILEILLKNGAGINIHDAWMSAAYYGQVANLKVLLENGAGVNACDRSGWTALMWSAKYGHIEAVKFLLDHGANVNIQDLLGKTAYRIAVNEGKGKVEEVLRILREYGGNFGSKPLPPRVGAGNSFLFFIEDCIGDWHVFVIMVLFILLGSCKHRFKMATRSNRGKDNS